MGHVIIHHAGIKVEQQTIYMYIHAGRIGALQGAFKIHMGS